jgi:transcriptional regulator with XRE-family HTH domain
MSGFDLTDLAKSNPAVARAKAVVDVVNQAAGVLRNWRSKHGLSQAAMAEKLGVSQPRIAQLESGKPGNSPSLEQIAEYAHHLGETVTVRDQAQIEDRSVSAALRGEIEALKTQIRGLKSEIASARDRPPAKVNYFDYLRPRARQPAPSYAPVPIPVAGYAASVKSGQQSIAIIRVDDDGKIHIDDGQGYQIGDVIGADSGVTVVDGYAIADQWGSAIVPKNKLKDLAVTIDKYASSKHTAYEVFKAFSDVVGPIEPGATIFKDKA